ILEVCPELRRLNARSFAEFISCGCVLEDRTLFEGIEVLPCASAWLCRDGRVQVKGRYFDPREWETLEPLAPDEYYGRLRGVFATNLPRYCESDERIGLSLTGGLDTRMILAWWRASEGTVPCYTFRGMFNTCQDAIIGRKIAELWHQPFQEIPVGQDFL